MRLRQPFTPRYCGRREYAARVALDVVSLLSAAFWLAHVTWFQHQPLSFRAALVTGMAYLSAVSLDTLRRVPMNVATPPARGVATPTPATDPKD